MILTKEQVQKRLASDSNIGNPNSTSNLEKESEVEVIYKDGINNHNGNAGSRNLTPEERITIGVLATVTDNKTAASIFGVHPSHVNDLKNGNILVGESKAGNRTRDNALIDAIKDRLETTKLTIQERAAEKLLGALGLLTEDKLENSSAKDIAQISNQMSQVVRNISGNNKNENEKRSNVRITVHQPKETRESAFDMIEIGI